MRPEVNLFDISLGLMYVFIIFFFALFIKKVKIKSNQEYNYFIPALSLKLVGGILFAFISMYYYKGGDTFVFFNAAEGLRQTIFNNLDQAILIYFLDAKDFDPSIHTFAPSYNYILKSKDVFAMVKITSFFNLFSFGSYLVSSILMAFFSFLGLWMSYSSLCKLYPKAAKYLFIPFFLIPSSILWSSGILKDTLTIAMIGWIIYAVANVFIFKKRLFMSLFLIVLSSWGLLLLKPYLLYILIPSIFIWIQTNLKNVLKGSFLRFFLTPFLVVILVVFGYLLIQEFSESAGKYNLENIETALIGFQSWHEYLAENRDQSGYSLGEIEFSFVGILTKSPAAFTVTFFRPYLWEVRNLPTLLGAIEGLLLFIFFWYLLIKLRLRFFSILFKNKEVLFLMIFGVVFGIVVGISSYNFGALSRYKIPAEIFFITSLIIIYHESLLSKTLKNS